MNLIDFSKKLYFDNHPLVMGILNVTPDSFSDGGKYLDLNKAFEHAVKMYEDGADIIDVGGESTRPNAEIVPEQEELERVIPVIEKICKEIDIAVSVDTYKAGTADAAIKAGALIVNDISAFGFDPTIIDVVKKSGCFAVLMHIAGTPRTMQENPFYSNVVENIYDFLSERVDFSVNNGIERNKIIIDPGIGFGKTFEHNVQILKNIEKFRQISNPLLIGVSRKSMIGRITGAPANERDWGTAALTAYCVTKGVRIHRVHEVKGIRQVCDVIYALEETDGN